MYKKLIITSFIDEISNFTVEVNNHNIYRILTILAIQPFVSSMSIHDKKTRELYSNLDSQYLYTQSMSTGNGFLTDYGYSGSNQIIGLILTGIDTSSCFFDSNIYSTSTDSSYSSTSYRLLLFLKYILEMEHILHLLLQALVIHIHLIIYLFFCHFKNNSVL